MFLHFVVHVFQLFNSFTYILFNFDVYDLIRAIGARQTGAPEDKHGGGEEEV